jgi:hypothetical protein
LQEANAVAELDLRLNAFADSIAAYKWAGHDDLVMANEGDFREDNVDRAAASAFGSTSPGDR